MTDAAPTKLSDVVSTTPRAVVAVANKPRMVKTFHLAVFIA
jgi:hypothetical protein